MPSSFSSGARSDPKNDTTDLRFQPPSGSMGHRFLSGALLTALVQVVRAVVQFASVILLARLLAPADFGIVAMAGPVVGFVTMFTDMGLNQAAVQRATITHSQINALFWVSVALSAGIMLILLLISPLVGKFYGDARAGWVCAASAVPILISSLGSQHFALLSRTMRFQRLAVIDVICAPLGLIAAVIAAQAGAGYWALVAAAYASAIAPAVAGWAAFQWRPSKPALDPSLKSMLGYGAGITGFNVSNYISRNLDNVLIGREWGASQLGFYDRAYKLLLLPLSQVTGPISRVTTPTLARLQDDPDRYRRIFIDVVIQMLLLAVPGVIVLISTADVFVPALMGEKWRAVVPIFIALGYAGLVQPLNNPTGWLFMTQNRTVEYAAWGLVSAATNVAAFLLGLPYGALGVATAYAISEFVRTPAVWWLATRRGPVGKQDILAIAAPFILSSGTSLLLLSHISPEFANKPFLAISCAVLISYGSALGCLLAFGRSRASLSRTVALVRSFIISVRDRRATLPS